MCPRKSVTSLESYRAIVLARDDDPLRQSLIRSLHECGSQPIRARSVSLLLDLIANSPPDCVILPASHHEAENIEIVRRIRQADKSRPILLFLRNITADAAMAAMRAGVTDVLDPGATQEEIVAVLRRFAPKSPIQRGECILAGGERLVGRGPAMEEVRGQIARVAGTEANVLITGETGTGKELAAELIHRNSRRRSKHFVSVNCAAIPDALLESELFGHEQGAFTGASAARDGKLQHASGGTLFLDEIGDMSLLSQAKILRAIENRVVQRLGSNTATPIHLRLIAATNQNLDQLAAEKRFRQDLYFRLNVVRIHLPPLRDRQEDIPELAEHLMRDLSAQYQTEGRSIQREVLHRLQMHDWPGNIRELRNVIESMVVLSNSASVTMADLPRYMRGPVHGSIQTSMNERAQIISALSSVDWNRSEAAKILRCSRMTLYRKMIKYQISSAA